MPADPTIDLRDFDLDALDPAADFIRGAGRDATSGEEAAQRVVTYLYEHLVDGATGERACALVRLYKTHPYGELEPDLQEFARDLLPDGDEPDGAMRCLTLLGTAGDLPEWNSRHASVGHRAIPLVSGQMVERLPMVNQLIRQLGLDVETVLAPPEEELVDLAQRTYDVFHVGEARGSPYLPAQDFVERHGIRSAIGFGGMLFSGDLYAIVLFSKVPVEARVARGIRILALPLRVALLRFVRHDVFAPAPA